MSRWQNDHPASEIVPLIHKRTADNEFELVPVDGWWPLKKSRLPVPPPPKKIPPHTGQWELAHLPYALRQAKRIARRMGLDVEAGSHVICNDKKGDWWCWPYDPNGPTPSLAGTTLTLGLSEADALPSAFVEKFGGQYGPMAWALSVLCLADTYPEVFEDPFVNKPAGVEFDISRELTRRDEQRIFDLKQSSIRKRPNEELDKFLVQQIDQWDKSRGLLALAKYLINERNKEPPTELGRNLRELGLNADAKYLSRNLRELELAHQTPKT